MLIPDKQVLDLLKLATKPIGHPFWFVYLGFNKRRAEKRVDKGFLEIVDHNHPDYTVSGTKFPERHGDYPLRSAVMTACVEDVLTPCDITVRLTDRFITQCLQTGVPKLLEHHYHFNTAYLLGREYDAQKTFLGIGQRAGEDVIVRPERLVTNIHAIRDYCTKHGLSLIVHK